MNVVISDIWIVNVKWDSWCESKFLYVVLRILMWSWYLDVSFLIIFIDFVVNVYYEFCDYDNLIDVGYFGFCLFLVILFIWVRGGVCKSYGWFVELYFFIMFVVGVF